MDSWADFDGGCPGGRCRGITSNIDSMVHATRQSYSAPGSWNDADMLQVCMHGAGATPGAGMSDNEYRVHYTVWAVLASPLVLGTDVRSLAADHPECLALLLNEDIVAVNQDAAGLPPRLVYQQPPLSPNSTTPGVISQAFARPLSGGRLAVLLLNRAAAPLNLSVSWAELQLPPTDERRVYDVIARRPAGAARGLQRDGAELRRQLRHSGAAEYS